jgi:hypothetical protein
MRRVVLLVGSVVLLFVAQIFGTDCPGFCVQCRTDAISVCGSGCIASYSCSLSTCTCQFSCRTGGGCPGAPVGARWPESLNHPKLELASWQGSTSYSPPDVKFDVIAQPEVPLAIDNVSLHNDPGRQISELTYTITNKSGIPVRGVSLFVTFFNGMNQPLGGEVIRDGESCTRGEDLEIKDSKELSTTLSHYVDSGQRVSLAVSSYRTDTQTWNGNHESIVRSMKQPH